MNETKFGIWCAHKEGRILIDKEKTSNFNFKPALFYNSSEYPENPNGSTDNIAGVVSNCGRILGLMPHFERSFINYQCGFIPEEYKKICYTPWFYIALNIIKFINQQA